MSWRRENLECYIFYIYEMCAVAKHKQIYILLFVTQRFLKLDT